MYNMYISICTGYIERDVEPGAAVAEPAGGGGRGGAGGQPVQRLRARGPAAGVPPLARAARHRALRTLPAHHRRL